MSFLPIAALAPVLTHRIIRTKKAAAIAFIAVTFTYMATVALSMVILSVRYRKNYEAAFQYLVDSPPNFDLEILQLIPEINTRSAGEVNIDKQKVIDLASSISRRRI